MKIAYIASGVSSKFDGVNKKLLSTINKWNEMGHDARLILVEDKTYIPPIEFLNNPSVMLIHYKKRLEFYLSKCLLEDIEKWDPEVIYVRGIVPHYMRSLRLFGKRGYLIVQEVNTNDIAEIRNILFESILKFNLNGVKWTSLYLIARKIILRRIDGIVLLSNELARIIPKRKPRIVVGDGINLKQYPEWKDKKSYRQSDYNIVFLGTSDRSWYGINKIVMIANEFPEFTIHLIGLYEDVLKNYSVFHNNIKCYGFLEREKYEFLMKEMDVAVGSLSLHVNGMTESSPLKGREYLAYGIPTIIGYRDTDYYDKTPEYILQLPSSDDNVRNNLDQIKTFIERSKKMKIDRNEILHLDFEDKEKKRIDFFISLLSVKDD
jgi:hypothetical protein